MDALARALIDKIRIVLYVCMKCALDGTHTPCGRCAPGAALTSRRGHKMLSEKRPRSRSTPFEALRAYVGGNSIFGWQITTRGQCSVETTSRQGHTRTAGVQIKNSFLHCILCSNVVLRLKKPVLSVRSGVLRLPNVRRRTVAELLCGRDQSVHSAQARC